MKTPHQQMSELDHSGTTYTVHVHTLHNTMRVFAAGVVSHSEGWILVCEGNAIPLWINMNHVIGIHINVN